MPIKIVVAVVFVAAAWAFGFWPWECPRRKGLLASMALINASTTSVVGACNASAV
jgi:hypothetical protein